MMERQKRRQREEKQGEGGAEERNGGKEIGEKESCWQFRENEGKIEGTVEKRQSANKEGETKER